jgi:hypothetical protein
MHQETCTRIFVASFIIEKKPEKIQMRLLVSRLEVVAPFLTRKNIYEQKIRFS